MKLPTRNRPLDPMLSGLAAIGALALLTPSLQAVVTADTFAYWNFDQGTPGAPFSPGTAGGASFDVPDQGPHGFWLSGWNEQFGPAWSQVGDTPTGVGLSARHVQQDAFSGAPGNELLNSWSPLVWTIELAVKLDDVGGWRTIVGRDGSSHPDVGTSHIANKSDLYIQNTGDGSNAFRLDFRTVGLQNVVITAPFTAVANQWYGLAAVSDGANAYLYFNSLDGTGWALAGSESLTGVGGDNALASTGGVWTFGRGWYNGGFGDHITGNLDGIRFSNAALAPEQFLAIPEPSTYALLVGLGVIGLALLRRRRRL
jgi:hypothetical protein